MRDLSKKKLSQLAAEMENAQEIFRHKIEVLAERARAEILPYFKKHDLDYTAGNGTWFISKPAADKAPYYRPGDHVDDDDLPANIRELLWLEVARGDHLGYYVRDIKRGEW